MQDFYREIYVMVRDDEESKTAVRSQRVGVREHSHREHSSRSSRRDSPSRKRSSRRDSSSDRGSKRHHREGNHQKHYLLYSTCCSGYCQTPTICVCVKLVMSPEQGLWIFDTIMLPFAKDGFGNGSMSWSALGLVLCMTWTEFDESLVSMEMHMWVHAVNNRR